MRPKFLAEFGKWSSLRSVFDSSWPVRVKLWLGKARVQVEAETAAGAEVEAEAEAEAEQRWRRGENQVGAGEWVAKRDSRAVWRRGREDRSSKRAAKVSQLRR